MYFQTLDDKQECVGVYTNGKLYFDTFPDHSGLDPVSEARTNISTVNRLIEVAKSLLSNKEMAAAIKNQDAPASMEIVQTALSS